MNRFLKYWRQQGKGEEYRAEVVADADDFVILTKRSAERRSAEAARHGTQKGMGRIGLTLNEQKTSIRDAWKESVDFLGYTFGLRYRWQNGKPYSGCAAVRKEHPTADEGSFGEATS